MREECNLVCEEKIIVVRGNVQKPISAEGCRIVTAEDLSGWLRSGSIVKHLLRYREAQLLTSRPDVMTRPFLSTFILRLLSWGRCFVQDELGQQEDITVDVLGRLFYQFIRDYTRKQALISKVRRELEDLGKQSVAQKAVKRLDLTAMPVYLRTDLWFGVRAGGSVGHIAGVLNHLDHFAGKPIFLTTDQIPTVRTDIEMHLIAPERAFWDFRELPSMFFNETLRRHARSVLQGRRLSFIYQRYNANNYSGVKLAHDYIIPFVLEYNGSEIWVSRHWGTPLLYESLCEDIELLNLKAADVVVVVSTPIYDELVARGIEPEKILVNPNGVDPERYAPSVDGSQVRRQYDLTGKTVLGFIGTFGKWHGAEVLAKAFGRLWQQFPAYRDRVRLLMIGDGFTMPLVRETLEKFDAMPGCILTGLLPQEEGPVYLGACDILVSPHVPNPDGTPFFGSPTKLFEYMAMGKGIVASALDQIGEVLEHQHTAWMVTPGNCEALLHGMKTLIDDVGLRGRLGQAARDQVVAQHTWEQHTEKIIDKLRERCTCS
jgi:glycosyltransferase involved in cell wall biosynthesis